MLLLIGQGFQSSWARSITKQCSLWRLATHWYCRTARQTRDDCAALHETQHWWVGQSVSPSSHRRTICICGASWDAKESPRSPLTFYLLAMRNGTVKHEFSFQFKKGSWKNFQWALRLWVGRWNEPTSGYAHKNDGE